MKKSNLVCLIIVILLIPLMFISCQKTMSVDDEREYRNGYKNGEKVAKQDAIKHGCTGTIENPSSNVYFQKRKYRAELEKTESDKYIKGFLWGYESAFIDHIGLYCGGNRDYQSQRRNSFLLKPGFH